MAIALDVEGLCKIQTHKGGGRGYRDAGPDVPYEDVVESVRDDDFFGFCLIDAAANDGLIYLSVCSFRFARLS